MPIDKLIITILGALGIVLTYIYFFDKKEVETIAEDSIDIIVEGGYNPSQIVIKKDQPTTLNFIRKDANPCLEGVVLSDFKVKKNLPLNEKVSVVLNPKQAGEFPFSCGMGMFHGKIIVK